VGSNPSITLKLDGKDGPLVKRKTTKIIKTAKQGKSHQKTIFKKINEFKTCV